jgi:DMSO/TMAO reductase YedYZ heme-binding membrane subunit
LVYAAVLLTAVHYFMATKVALTAPLLHGAAALGLLALRWLPACSRTLKPPVT